MDIRIRETDKLENLSIIDPKTGVDYISDFIGNAGGLTDGQFELYVYEWVADDDFYACDQETYEWWADVVDAHNNINSRIFELSSEHGSETITEAIGDAGNCDVKDQPAAIDYALDAFLLTVA